MEVVGGLVEAHWFQLKMSAGTITVGAFSAAATPGSTCEPSTVAESSLIHQQFGFG